MSSNSPSLEERLNAQPQLKGCSEALLAIVEDAEDDVKQAAEAERRVLEELRRWGKEALRSWAAKQEAVQVAAVCAQGETGAQGKKTLRVHDVWGHSRGRTPLRQESGLLRPFCRSAGVRCRGYSHPLQRRMSDFGADEAFGQVPAKLKEHYGREVPLSAMRTITEGHAGQIHAHLELQATLPAGGVEWVIAETDGSMIPLVETAAPAQGERGGERRQTRQVRWKEARLSLAQAQGAGPPTFAATLGEPEAVGEQLWDCALRAGLGKTSRVHSVGDGAPWIAIRYTGCLVSRGRIWWIFPI